MKLNEISILDLQPNEKGEMVKFILKLRAFKQNFGKTVSTDEGQWFDNYVHFGYYNQTDPKTFGLETINGKNFLRVNCILDAYVSEVEFNISDLFDEMALRFDLTFIKEVAMLTSTFEGNLTPVDSYEFKLQYTVQNLGQHSIVTYHMWQMYFPWPPP